MGEEARTGRDGIGFGERFWSIRGKCVIINRRGTVPGVTKRCVSCLAYCTCQGRDVRELGVNYW